MDGHHGGSGRHTTGGVSLARESSRDVAHHCVLSGIVTTTLFAAGAASVVAMATVATVGLDALRSMVEIHPTPERGRVSGHASERKADGDERWFHLTGRHVSVVRRPGARLHAVMLDPDMADPPAHRYVICCPDELRTGRQAAATAHRFARMGANVLVPQSRGDGGVQSRYRGMGLRESGDVIAWIAEVLVHDPQAHVVLHGISVGAVTAMMACRQARLLPRGVVSGIIVESGFANAYDHLIFSIRRGRRLPEVPARASAGLANALCRRRAGYDLRAVDCLKALRGSRIPTLFITAGRDHVVDPRDAGRLFASCTADMKERLFVADAIHGECQEADSRTYWTTVRDFLSRCLW